MNNMERLPEPVVSTGNSRSGDDKRYHTRECQALRRTKGTRPATDTEVGGYDECSYCQGQKPNQSPDFSYQRSLREAASND